jgi:hypothetical protein
MAKRLLMNDSVPGTGDISRDQMEAEILGEMGSEKKKDESDYTNPALEFTDNVGVNNYRAPSNLGINQALNVEIGGNSEAMVTANQAQASDGDDAAAAGGQSGSFSSQRASMFADKYGGSSNSFRNKVPGAPGTRRASMADPTENSGGSQGINQQQVSSQDPLNQMPVEKAVYSGYYQVKITSGKADYNLNALVKEDGDGNMKITGEYAHTNFSLNGELTQATTDTGTWLVDLKQNKLFKGLAKITIMRAVVGYKMTGKVNMSTNFVVRKGKTSATIEGSKIAEAPPAAPPNLFDNLGAKVAFMAPDKPFEQPTPVASGLASTIAAFSAIVAGMSAAKRRNKVGRKGEILPMSHDDSPTAHEMQTAQFGQEVIPQIDPKEAEPEPPKKTKGAVIKLSKLKKDDEKPEEDSSQQIVNLPAIIEPKNNDPRDGEGVNNG